MDQVTRVLTDLLKESRHLCHVQELRCRSFADHFHAFPICPALHHHQLKLEIAKELPTLLRVVLFLLQLFDPPLIFPRFLVVPECLFVREVPVRLKAEELTSTGKLIVELDYA